MSTVLDFLYYLTVFLCNSIITLPGMIYSLYYKRHLRTRPAPHKVPKSGKHEWIIFVHGHNGCPQEFYSLAQAINIKHPNLQFWCVRFGKNTHTSIYNQVATMHMLLAKYQNRITSMKLVGLSMGGVVAMLYANAYPEKITSVITVSSPIGGTKIATYNPIYPLVRKELGYGSKNLSVLQNKPETYQVYHIVPWWDNLIRPMDTAKTKYGFCYYYKGFNSHFGVLEARDIINQIVSWIG